MTSDVVKILARLMCPPPLCGGIGPRARMRNVSELTITYQLSKFMRIDNYQFIWWLQICQNVIDILLIKFVCFDLQYGDGQLGNCGSLPQSSQR